MVLNLLSPTSVERQFKGAEIVIINVRLASAGTSVFLVLLNTFNPEFNINAFLVANFGDIAHHAQAINASHAFNKLL